MTQQPTASTRPPANAKLARLLQYLEQDPHNPPLLADAAEAALACRRGEGAARLLGRLGELGPLSPAAVHLKGIAALQAQDFVTAEALFAGLIADGHDSPAIRFNLAWTKAVRGDHAGALEWLGDDAVAVSERGPALKVQMLHHLARLEDALAVGDVLLAHYPANAELAGALSVVAMDAGDMARAADYAARGGSSADALSTLGLVALSNYEQAPAMALFARALDVPGAHPRAWLGQGLARMSSGDAKGACHDLERAASLFGRHIGSWIAAGWAHYASRDLGAARRCFEAALALDANFGESHGSLAVLDLAEGRIDAARRGASVALKLDRQCFSGALAKSLLAEHDDNPLLAQKIRDRAMNVAIGADGRTIAQALVAMGLRPGGS